MAEADSRISDVVSFWRKAGPEAWFAKDDAFDTALRGNFLELHFEAARRRLDGWTGSPDGALALMILLDQFPRNCFRDTGHMYATDPLARMYARRIEAAGLDRELPQDQRVFLYLPFSHAEDLACQDLAVSMNERIGRPWLDHATGHRDIIRRFGRFPHRNAILGRDSTAEEIAFLEDGGFQG